MSGPRVIKKPRAKTDLVECADYIAQDNTSAAMRFLQAADDAFQLLADMPGIGRPRDEIRNPNLVGLRSWRIRGFESYLVFYRPVEHRDIEVIRVLHGARDLPAILEAENG